VVLEDEEQAEVEEAQALVEEVDVVEAQAEEVQALVEEAEDQAEEVQALVEEVEAQAEEAQALVDEVVALAEEVDEVVALAEEVEEVVAQAEVVEEAEEEEDLKLIFSKFPIVTYFSIKKSYFSSTFFKIINMAANTILQNFRALTRNTSSNTIVVLYLEIFNFIGL